jgi:hypothetical protein
MHRFERQPFTPKGDFVVRREFRFSGRDFRPGDDFLHRQMAISERQLRVLYDSGKIVYRGDEGKAEEIKTTEAPTTESPTTVADAVSAASGEIVASNVFLFDPDKHLIEKSGRSKWHVEDLDGQILAHLTKEQATELKKATEPVEVTLDEESQRENIDT